MTIANYDTFAREKLTYQAMNALQTHYTSYINTYLQLISDCVSANTANKVVKRDASGDFAAGTITIGGITATGNLDIGSYEFRAQTFQSDVTTGTKPFTVASTTLCDNLNADLLDGVHAVSFLLADGTRALTGNWNAGAQITATQFNGPLVGNVTGDVTGTATGNLKPDGSVALTANWDVGNYQLTAQNYISDVATGTQPYACTSTTKNTNLHADLLDTYHAGNSTGQIPVSNGTVCNDLNAEKSNGITFTVRSSSSVSITASGTVSVTFSGANASKKFLVSYYLGTSGSKVSYAISRAGTPPDSLTTSIVFTELSGVGTTIYYSIISTE